MFFLQTLPLLKNKFDISISTVEHLIAFCDSYLIMLWLKSMDEIPMWMDQQKRFC